MTGLDDLVIGICLMTVAGAAFASGYRYGMRDGHDEGYQFGYHEGQFGDENQV